MVKISSNLRQNGLLIRLHKKALEIAAHRAANGRIETRGMKLFTHRLK